MITLALLFQLAADPAAVARGEKLFAQNCSVGYCHGAGGAAARGPRLRGRTFSKEYLLKVTRDGIPRSAMPGWKDRLTDDEIQAVTAYIQTLSSGAADSTAVPADAAPASQSRVAPDRGETLFVERCAACHSARGKGKMIAPDISAMNSIPTASSKVQRIVLKDGDTFPALAGREDGGFVQVYDLTAPPPVRRTLERAEISSMKPENNWAHPRAGDDEVAAIRAWVTASQ